MSLRIQPQPGPQTEFIRTPADIAIYGGEAGGGKSHALLMEGARWHRLAGFEGLILRREATDLKLPGGLWSEACKMYPLLGATMRAGAEMDATWKSGATLKFSGIQRENDVYTYQGAQLAQLLLDELTHYLSLQFWYMLGRLRTTCGLKPYCRATVNPDPYSWVKDLIRPWLDADGRFALPEMSGKLLWIIRQGDAIRYFPTKADAQAFCREIGDKDSSPRSLTFIHARLSDNKLGDPNYRGQLALLDSVQRARLLDGDWGAVATPGSVFNPAWFAMLDSAPACKLIVRGWDRAGTAPTKENPNPDASATVKIGLTEDDQIVILHADWRQLEPGGIDAWMDEVVRQDGPRVIQARWQDPAQAGKAEALASTKVMLAADPRVDVDVVVERKNKEQYAALVSAAVDPRCGKRASVVRGPWVDRLFTELRGFPSPKVKKDSVDALSRAYLYIHDRLGSFAEDFMAGLARE